MEKRYEKGNGMVYWLIRRRRDSEYLVAMATGANYFSVFRPCERRPTSSPSLLLSFSRPSAWIPFDRGRRGYISSPLWNPFWNANPLCGTHATAIRATLNNTILFSRPLLNRRYLIEAVNVLSKSILYSFAERKKTVCDFSIEFLRFYFSIKNQFIRENL